MPLLKGPVTNPVVFDSAKLPLQAPLPSQAVALLDVQVMVIEPPALSVVGLIAMSMTGAGVVWLMVTTVGLSPCPAHAPSKAASHARVSPPKIARRAAAVERGRGLLIAPWPAVRSARAGNRGPTARGVHCGDPRAVRAHSVLPGGSECCGGTTAV